MCSHKGGLSKWIKKTIVVVGAGKGIRNRMGQKKTSDEEIRKLLNVPDGYTVLNLVAIGKKGENKSPYEEKDLDMNLVHFGEW